MGEQVVHIVSDSTPLGTRVEGVPYAYEVSFYQRVGEMPRVHISAYRAVVDYTGKADVIDRCPQCMAEMPPRKVVDVTNLSDEFVHKQAT